MPHGAEGLPTSWSGWRTGCAERARKSWHSSSSRRDLDASGNCTRVALADGRGCAAEQGMGPITAAVRLSPAAKEVDAAGTVRDERSPGLRPVAAAPL